LPDVAALRAKLAARVWKIAFYERGKVTMLEDGTHITVEMVDEWRKEIAELRLLTKAS
jgi:hypothetical protein